MILMSETRITKVGQTSKPTTNAAPIESLQKKWRQPLNQAHEWQRSAYLQLYYQRTCWHSRVAIRLVTQLWEQRICAFNFSCLFACSCPSFHIQCSHCAMYLRPKVNTKHGGENWGPLQMSKWMKKYSREKDFGGSEITYLSLDSYVYKEPRAPTIRNWGHLYRLTIGSIVSTPSCPESLTP